MFSNVITGQIYAMYLWSLNSAGMKATMKEIVVQLMEKDMVRIVNIVALIN